MIISIPAIIHIKKNTGKNIKTIYNDLKTYLDCDKYILNRIYIYYFLLSPNKENANSSIPYIVRINSKWIIELINNYNNKELINAFKITIGHELGHKQKHINRLKYLFDLRFLSWVQEVYCDFYGTDLMADGIKANLISSIIYKSKNKNCNKCDSSHPSWNNRLEYAKTGIFNEKLINQIYEDSGCNNATLLDKVIDFYKDKYIILK